MMKETRVRAVAEYGMLIAAAMLLSYVESMIPAFFAVPGMKLGLANTVVLFVLYTRGRSAALLINGLRIALVSALFTNGAAFLYSLAGAVLSCFTMFLLKDRFGVVTVSICGGIAHNAGQILMAMCLLGTTSLVWYLFVLWFTGIASGAAIGLIGGELIRRLAKAANGGKS